MSGTDVTEATPTSKIIPDFDPLKFSLKNYEFKAFIFKATRFGLYFTLSLIVKLKNYDISYLRDEIKKSSKELFKQWKVAAHTKVISNYFFFSSIYLYRATYVCMCLLGCWRKSPRTDAPVRVWSHSHQRQDSSGMLISVYWITYNIRLFHSANRCLCWKAKCPGCQ